MEATVSEETATGQPPLTAPADAPSTVDETTVEPPVGRHAEADEPAAPGNLPDTPGTAAPDEPSSGDLSDPTAAAAPSEPGAAAVPPQPGRRLTVALAVSTVVLLLASITLGVLWQRAESARQEQRRATAASEARLAQAREQLAALGLQKTAVEAALKDAQAKLIDPQGVELLKKCVAEVAAAEAEYKRFIADIPTRYHISDSGLFLSAGNLKDCDAAAPYLK